MKRFQMQATGFTTMIMAGSYGLLAVENRQLSHGFVRPRGKSAHLTHVQLRDCLNACRLMK